MTSQGASLESSKDRDRDLEAKLVILGAQGVGKTSLLRRYINNTFNDHQRSTIGANFLTKRILCMDTSPPTSLKLQIWDTAGQERFKAISKLYYRGADAALLCYDITSEKSFEEMGDWMRELRNSDGEDCIIHVVGTKADAAADDLTSRREVPFERCIQYVSEQLYGTKQGAHTASPRRSSSLGANEPHTSNKLVRDSDFWGLDVAWDSCHEISAKDGDGIEEVFRVLTRKLVERRRQQARQGKTDKPQSNEEEEDEVADYFARRNFKGSFRLTDKRRSWLSFPNTPAIRTPAVANGEDEDTKQGRCC